MPSLSAGFGRRCGPGRRARWSGGERTRRDPARPMRPWRSRERPWRSGQCSCGPSPTPAWSRAMDARLSAPVTRVAAVLQAGREAHDIAGATAESVLWAMWDASGLSDRWAQRAVGGTTGAAEADRGLDAMLALFDAASRFVDRLPAAGPEVFLDHVLGQQFPADSLVPTAPDTDAVALLTAHAAKGLEWDLVAVAGVNEGVWPDLRLSRFGARWRPAHRNPVRRGRDSGCAGLGPACRGDGGCSTSRSRGRGCACWSPASATTTPLRPASSTTCRSRQTERLPSLTEPGTWAGAGSRTGDWTPRRSPPICAVWSAVRIGRPTSGPHAAGQLASFAAAGVTGADPDEWYGLPVLSDDRPLVRAGEPVVVSPSKVESLQQCPLKVVLEDNVGATRPSVRQSVGNLVHELADDVATASCRLADLLPDARTPGGPPWALVPGGSTRPSTEGARDRPAAAGLSRDVRAGVRGAEVPFTGHDRPRGRERASSTAWNAPARDLWSSTSRRGECAVEGEGEGTSATHRLPGGDRGRGLRAGAWEPGLRRRGARSARLRARGCARIDAQRRLSDEPAVGASARATCSSRWAASSPDRSSRHGSTSDAGSAR